MLLAQVAKAFAVGSAVRFRAAALIQHHRIFHGLRDIDGMDRAIVAFGDLEVGKEVGPAIGLLAKDVGHREQEVFAGAIV